MCEIDIDSCDFWFPLGLRQVQVRCSLGYRSSHLVVVVLCPCRGLADDPYFCLAGFGVVNLYIFGITGECGDRSVGGLILPCVAEEAGLGLLQLDMKTEVPLLRARYLPLTSKYVRAHIVVFGPHKRSV